MILSTILGMIHRHDHQNHSRADHHDGAPGTIPMTIRPIIPKTIFLDDL